MLGWDSLVGFFTALLVALSQAYGGNLGSAIITVSVLIRLALLPLTLRIARHALALPLEDRIYLADLLELSLTTESVSPELVTAWTAEIDRRIEAYDRGQTHAVDAETAMREMTRALAERRAREK